MSSTIILKTPDEIAMMRESGRIVARALQAMREAVRPGISTAELNQIAETVIPSIVDPGGTQRRFDPAKHYLFPFPQSEMDINDKLVQNTGY